MEWKKTEKKRLLLHIIIGFCAIHFQPTLLELSRPHLLQFNPTNFLKYAFFINKINRNQEEITQ